MKYLTVPRLQKLSAMMQAVDVGDRIVHARIEAYSCKLAGTDKRAAKEITQAVTSKLSHPSGVYQLSSGSSPLGDLHEPATKQLLVSLITTLNASCPDYDFSGLRADDFEREESTQAAINSINTLFVTSLENALGVTGFRSELWSALEETIFLHECEVYKYDPGSGSDESVGKLWSINYFFFHRKLKKMVLLASEAVSKLHMQNAHSAAYQLYARRHGHGHSHGHARQQQGGSSDADMHADDGEWVSEGSDDDLDSDSESEGAARQAAQDAEDDAMEAAEEEMLQELAAENRDAGGEAAGGLAMAAGSYVDASLLEWEVPLEQQPQLHTPAASNLAPYESSPSASSTSSAATFRMRPLADLATPTLTPQSAAGGGFASGFGSGSASASAAHSPHSVTPLLHSPQVRLASTKSPIMRAAAVGKSFANPIVIGGAAAPGGSVGGHGSLPPRPQGTSLFGGSRSSFSPRQSQSHTPSILPAVPTFSQ